VSFGEGNRGAMTRESDWLRSQFQRSEATSVDEPCPAPEDLWALTRGELPEQSARRIILHSSRCAQCGSALRMALELGERLDPVVAAPNVTPLRRRLAVGMGVALAIAATIVAVPHLRQSETGIHERGGTTDGVRSLVPGTPRPRSGLVLEWTAYPGAVRYQVTLASADLRVLFQKAGVSGTRVDVPETAVASVPRGARLVWEVEAILPDVRAIKSAAFDLILE